MLKGVIQFLNDPNSVARFQRACGICAVDNNDDIPRDSERELNGTTEITDPQDKEKHLRYRAVGTNVNSHVRSGSNSSVSGGEDTEKDNFSIDNSFLFYLFNFGASLGNEIFYITFFPYWFWNIDGYVGRRICIFWCIFMYLGQATKDIVKWPRPASPPVMRLEKRYALEYGMPSTHSMVGAGVPFTILFLTSGRYIVSDFFFTFVKIMYMYICMKTVV